MSRVGKRHMGVEITLPPEAPWDEVSERLSQVFGVVKFYRCYKLPPSLEAIREFITEEIPKLTFNTFRITSKRGNKSFALTSPELNRELGTHVQQLTGAEVSLKDPEVNIFVEMLPREALVYFKEDRGPGGLPVGVGGKLVALMSGGIDSPVAAWRMMKRGCEVTFVHFHSFPLVDGTSREKAREIVELLNRHQFRSKLLLVPFADVQRDIILSVPSRIQGRGIPSFHGQDSPADSPGARRQGPGDGRKPGAGGIPDPGEHGDCQECARPPGVQPADRDGQGGDRKRGAEHRHIPHLHHPGRGLLHPLRSPAIP